MSKIMIVEDDPVARQILHSTLKQAKYEVVIATDAMTALPMAQREKPDLILLDLGLPAGGGMTFLQRLKSFPALAVTPIAVVSGFDPSTHEAAVKEAGVAAYLKKPVSPPDLIATVKRLLGE